MMTNNHIDFHAMVMKLSPKQIQALQSQITEMARINLLEERVQKLATGYSDKPRVIPVLARYFRHRGG
jgi:ABC-type Na+ transport system ATPase subunit NatA